MDSRVARTSYAPAFLAPPNSFRQAPAGRLKGLRVGTALRRGVRAIMGVETAALSGLLVRAIVGPTRVQGEEERVGVGPHDTLADKGSPVAGITPPLRAIRVG